MRGKRRRLGQHYLVRIGSVISWFRPRICGRRVVVEIGAGHGEITRYLASCVESYIAVEVDRNLIPHLAGLLLSEGASFYPLNCDAMHPPLNFKVIEAVLGNLPYSLSTQLLVMMVKAFQGPVYVMVQREVARRLAAKPGNDDYGRLSVIVQLIYRVNLGPIIPPHFFEPPPRVYSQLVELEPTRRCSERYLSCLERFTSCLFSYRRRIVRKVLRSCSVTGASIDKELEVKRVVELSVKEVEALAEKHGGCEPDCNPI